MNQPDVPRNQISLSDFQALIHAMYYDKDAQRGTSGTFMWLMEEIGELAAVDHHRQRRRRRSNRRRAKEVRSRLPRLRAFGMHLFYGREALSGTSIASRRDRLALH